MTAPTSDQSRGYDIVIWADEGGRILAKSYTILGEVSFHGLLPDHKMGQEVDLEFVAMPDDFFKAMPPGVKIGALNPQNGKIYLQQGLATLN